MRNRTTSTGLCYFFMTCRKIVQHLETIALFIDTIVYRALEKSYMLQCAFACAKGRKRIVFWRAQQLDLTA